MKALASATYTYKVTNQTPTTGQDSAARYGPGMLVSIKTDKSGILGQLFIPQAEYDPPKVQAALAAFATRLEQVHALTGQ